MVLINVVHKLEVVYLHVEGLLVISDVLHFLDKLVAFDFVQLDVFNYHLD